MSTAAIIILIIFILLLLAGIGVGLYFAFRKSGTTTQTPTNLQAVNGGSTGTTGTTGTTGGDGGVTGAFAITPLNSNFRDVVQTRSGEGAGSDFVIDVILSPVSSTTNCNQYRFRYGTYQENGVSIPNALIFQGTDNLAGSGAGVLCSTGLNESVKLINPSAAAAQLCSWTYDIERMTWHLSSNSSQVLGSFVGASFTVLNLVELPTNFDSLPAQQKARYQWVNGPLPQTNAQCLG